MKKIITLILLYNAMYSFGQSYEEKIALKSCDCISKSSDIKDINGLLKKCIISSKIEVENNDTNEKENRQFTVEGIRKTFSVVSKLVIENCVSLKTKLSEQKKSKFYKLSDDLKANKYFEKGNELKERKQYDLAIEEYKKAIKRDKKFVFAYDHLGVAYRRKNDFKNAVDSYKKSLELFPEGDFALLNIAVIYSIQKEDSKAEQYYLKLINYYPENPEGYYGMGSTNLFQGKNESALKNTLKALIIYKNQNSNKISDAKKLLHFIYAIMKKNNELEMFNRILKEFNVKFEE